jgi:transcription initiation factor TFIID subunit TAF12
MWKDEQRNTNKQETEQTDRQRNKNSRFRNNVSHILSSGVTPPVSNPVVGV